LLGPRLIELDADSIEEYVPEPLYAEAGLVKQNVLDALKRLNTYEEQRDAKRSTSASPASVLTRPLLDEVPLLKKAAELALSMSTVESSPPPGS
jgi:hypothetical protein